MTLTISLAFRRSLRWIQLSYDSERAGRSMCSGDVIMSRDGWETLIVGGAGGVAPLLFKGFGILCDQKNFYRQVDQLDTHNLFWLFLLVSACFVVGCIGALFQPIAEPDQLVRIRKVFFLGVAAPALGLQLFNGTGGAQYAGSPDPAPKPIVVEPAASASPHTGARPNGVMMIYPGRDPRVVLASFAPIQYAADTAAASAGRYSLTVSVTCPNCAENPIHVVQVGTSDGVRPVELTFGQGWISQTIPVVLHGADGDAVVKIPNYQGDARNGTVWNPEARSFPVRPGEAVTLQIDVRPGVWNAFRTTVGWPAFYVIRGLRVTRP